MRRVRQCYGRRRVTLAGVFASRRAKGGFGHPECAILIRSILQPKSVLVIARLSELKEGGCSAVRRVRQVGGVKIQLVILRLPAALVSLSIVSGTVTEVVLRAVGGVVLRLCTSVTRTRLRGGRGQRQRKVRTGGLQNR